MTDTQIRVLAIFALVACIEFIACVWMYDQLDKHKKRAEYWRGIAKEQAVKPSYMFMDKPQTYGEYTPEPGGKW